MTPDRDFDTVLNGTSLDPEIDSARARCLDLDTDLIFDLELVPDCDSIPK